MKNVYVVIVEKCTPGNWKDEFEVIEIVVFSNKEKAEEYKNKRQEQSLIYCQIKDAVFKE